MTIQISLKDRGAARRCVYCRDQLEGPSWTCDGCHLSLHTECADDLSVCPTAGCSRPTHRRPRRSRRSAPERPRTVIGSEEQNTSGWGVLGAVIYVVVMGVGGVLEKCSTDSTPQRQTSASRQASQPQRRLPANLWALRDVLLDSGQGCYQRRPALDELIRRAKRAGDELDPLLALAEVAVHRPITPIEQIAEESLHLIGRERGDEELSRLVLALAGKDPERVADLTRGELGPLRVQVLIRMLDPRHDYGRLGRSTALQQLVAHRDAIPLRHLDALVKVLAERLVPTLGLGDDALVTWVERLQLESEVIRKATEMRARGDHFVQTRLIRVLRRLGEGSGRIEASVALAQLARNAASSVERAKAAKALQELQRLR